jgi:DNA-binding MarR family transcriptional regulator
MAPTDTTLVEEIGRGIMRVRRLILTEGSKRLEEHGEQLLPWQVLNYLDRTGPSSQAELAQGTGQHPTGLSRLLDELEKSGHVRRRRDARDRRRLVVEPTAAGLARLRLGRPVMHAAVGQVLGPLDAKSRKALRDLLSRLVEGNVTGVFRKAGAR